MFHKNSSRFVYGRKSLPAICASAQHEQVTSRGPGTARGRSVNRFRTADRIGLDGNIMRCE